MKKLQMAFLGFKYAKITILTVKTKKTDFSPNRVLLVHSLSSVILEFKILFFTIFENRSYCVRYDN